MLVDEVVEVLLDEVLGEVLVEVLVDGLEEAVDVLLDEVLDEVLEEVVVVGSGAVVPLAVGCDGWVPESPDSEHAVPSVATVNRATSGIDLERVRTATVWQAILRPGCRSERTPAARFGLRRS